LQALISFRIKDKSVTGYDILEQTANVNADLVLMGASKCWAQLDPKFFEATFHLKTVNIAVDGHTEIAMAKVRLDDYLSRNKSPKYAIMSFDPFMKPGSEAHNDNFVHKNYFARYAFLPKEKDERFVNIFQFDNYEKYIPLYAIFKYSLFKNCITLKNESNYMQYGYEMHTEKWDTVANPVKDIMKSRFFSEKEIIPLKAALNDLNLHCQKNGIKLMCIETPVYKVIYDSIVFARNAAICKSLNIPYIQVNAKNIRDNVNNFYNSNHMNVYGVKELNKIMAADTTLQSILKRK
jgi:hypothetical protein